MIVAAGLWVTAARRAAASNDLTGADLERINGKGFVASRGFERRLSRRSGVRSQRYAAESRLAAGHPAFLALTRLRAAQRSPKVCRPEVHCLQNATLCSMRRRSHLSRKRSRHAAGPAGRPWHRVRPRASCSSMKPLPSRALGTGAWVVLPQATRGTSACSKVSKWKKSRRRYLRSIRS